MVLGGGCSPRDNSAHNTPGTGVSKKNPETGNNRRVEDVKKCQNNQ